MAILTRRAFVSALAAIGLAPKVLAQPKSRIVSRITFSSTPGPRKRVLIDPDGWVRRRVPGDTWKPPSGRLYVTYHVGRSTIVRSGDYTPSRPSIVDICYEKPHAPLYRCPDGEFAEAWVQVDGTRLPPIHDQMDTYGWERAFVVWREKAASYRIWQQGVKA